MKKSFLFGVMTLFMAAIGFSSCSDDDKNVTPEELEDVIEEATITIDIPNNISDVELSDVTIQLINVETLDTVTVSGTYTIEDDKIIFTIANLPAGSYNIMVNGHISYITIGGVAAEQDFELTQESAELTQTESATSLTISTFTTEGGFVLSEIFLAGSVSTSNQFYMYDAYFVITNNSDVTLFADSIAIMESAYVSQATGNHEWDPDFRSEAFSAQALFMIPGSGKSLPVEPGNSIVIANNAMNHTTINDGSLDLTNADFEIFYDASSNPNNGDTDYDASNLENWFCSSSSIWIPSVQMNRSYAIARMQQSKEDFLAAHSVVPTYIAATGKEMYSKEVQVPNEWILDAVNLGQEDDYDWNVISEKLDAGFVVGRENKSDVGQRGTSVVRKKDAKGKYVDTNNSTNDFLNRQIPSLKK